MTLRRLKAFSTASLLVCSVGAANTSFADRLSDALNAALTHHPAVAGQAAMVESRRFAADRARSQRYPTLSAQAQSDGGYSSVTGDSYSPAVLRLRQPIYAFGRINSSIAVANADMDAEKADLMRVRRQLLEETAVAYAFVRGSNERIEVARQNVAEHGALLAQIERRVEGQLASSADARLAAARLAQARAQLGRAISEWQGANLELGALTQVTISAEEPVPMGLLALGEDTDLLNRAMEYNADIQYKKQMLAKAEAEVKEAKTYSMPTIYLQADRYHDQPGLQDTNHVGIVFEATLDGMGFAARGRRGEAAASKMAASQDLAAARIQLQEELDQLQRNRRLQTELIELQTQSLLDLESLLASYQRQYESGTKSWLDLLNIQREYYEQRRQLVQARNDWVIYSLRLQARIGGLDGLVALDEQTDG